jgi:Domain of unknown function (DUF1996)
MMQASSQRTTGQVRLALMLMVGVAAAAACVVTLMLWKAPVASAQDEGGDPTGANFVVSCGFSHERQVDPIVNPGPSGTNPDGTLVTPPPTPAHHMHHFFGNTTTDSNSTLDNSTPPWTSLRAGGTTCAKPKDTAAYWIPKVSWTASRGKITPLKANQTFFYYRAGLKDPKAVKPFPPGLKVVTVQGKKVEWRCQGGTWSPTPPTRCDNGTLVVRIFFPDCLAVDNSVPPPHPPRTDTDPKDPNAIPHRSHMVDAVTPSTGGFGQCPNTHPYPVPRLQTNFLFRIPTTKGRPTLSSGEADTMHVDFFNAWQPPQQPPPTPPAVDGTLEDLVARCINAGPFTSSKPKPRDCA